MARRAAYIDTTASKTRHLTLIDSGNIISRPGVLPKIKTEFLFRAMDLMDYDIFTPGNNDFSFGADYLFSMLWRHDIMPVSANLLDSHTGVPITEPVIIHTYNTVSIAFIGAVAERYAGTITAGNDNNTTQIAVANEFAAIKEQVSAISPIVDAVVVVAHVGLKQAQEIARRIDGIDVILCGHGYEVIQDPYIVNGTYILKAGYYGQHIGRVALSFSRDRDLVKIVSSVKKLGPDVPEDRELLALVDEYHARLAEYRDELFDTGKQTPAEGLFYVGSDNCLRCHVKQAGRWRMTKHAEAFESLASRNQDYNPECVPCHSTGFGFKGGLSRPDLDPDMINVQCESCHGAGGEHVLYQTVPYGETEKKTCTACHDESHSPSFDYDEYYEKVYH